MGRFWTPSVGDWYKWVILVSACLCQTFCFGYLNSTLAFYAIYYADRFGDRKIAGVIGPLASALFCLLSFPVLFICKRIGERCTQLIGGAMLVVGVGCTAFATQGWHAVLATGVLAGTGAAIVQAAVFSIVARYFPGKQLAPFAAMSACYTIGILIFPQIVGQLMKQVGYTYTLLCCSAFLMINLFVGFLFFPKESTIVDEDDDMPNAPRFALKFNGTKSGVYHVPQLHEIVPTAPAHYVKFSEKQIEVRALEALQEEETIEGFKSSDDNSTSNNTGGSQIAQLIALTTISALTNPAKDIDVVKNLKPKQKNRQNSTLSQVIAKLSDDMAVNILVTQEEKQSCTCDKEKPGTEEVKDASKIKKNKANPSTLKTRMSETYGLTIAELLDDTKLVKKSIRGLFKQPQVVLLFVCAYLLQASYFSFGAVLGDYCRNRLMFTDEQFGMGMTMIGIVQLPCGIIYLLLTRFCTFSASFLHSINMGIVGSVMIAMLSDPSYEIFLVLMGIYGMCRALYIGNGIPLCMEAVPPTQAVLVYLITSAAEGVGGLTIPYLAAYLQVEIDMRYGIVFSGCLMLTSSFLFLPIGLKSLISPKTYTKFDEVKENVQQTKHLSLEDQTRPERRKSSITIMPIMHM